MEEMKKRLVPVLPRYLLSHICLTMEKRLQQDASRVYTAPKHDNAPLKQALDRLRVCQQGLEDWIHENEDTTYGY